jgi:two-component system chemotaxis sensor kinase CheA
VIAVTSLATDADLERGTAAGVDEYHVKLDRDQLIAAIAKRLKTVRRQNAATSG